jgi:hypothetical protein
MESNKFDRYIREIINLQKVTELPDERERTWNAIERQLEKKQALPWFGMAALILILLMPSVFLFLQNRRQAGLISRLHARVAILDQQARQPAGSTMLQPSDTARIPGETIRPSQPTLTEVRIDTVQLIRYITDTVIVYRQTEYASTMSSGIEPSGQDTFPGPSEFYGLGNSQKTEFLLTGSKKSGKLPGKQAKSSLRFTLGNLSDNPESISGIKARL